MSRTLLVLTLAVAAGGGPPVAATTRILRERMADVVGGAERLGVALAPDGSLVLAPQVRLIPLPEASRIWALRADPHGRLYVATGGKGAVWRLDPGGDDATVVFRAGEPEVQALLLDGDSVLAATGPEGRVYRLREDREPEVFFDPPDPYIWDLARGDDGVVYVATGNHGVIYRVRGPGPGEVFYDSPATHVRAMTRDARGRLLAATAGGAYLYRFDGSLPPSVLLAAPEAELVDVAVSPDGVVFAAGLGDVPPSGRGPAQGRIIRAPAAEHVTVTASADEGPPPATQTAPTSRPDAAASGPRQAAVYRIDPGGRVLRLLASVEMELLSLAAGPEGDVLAGGSEGRLLRLRPDGGQGQLGELPASRVTALWQLASGVLAAGTASPAVLGLFGPARAEEGSLLSTVRDAGMVADWGRVRWRGDPGGGRLQVAIRSGDTAVPDDTWSQWYDAESSADVPPPARYLQFRVTLVAGGGPSPRLEEVTIAYRQRNQAPALEAPVWLAPGVVQFLIPNPQPDQEEVARAEAENGDPAAAQSRQPPRKTYREGHRTLTWEAGDPNEDPLRFTVEIRRRGDVPWRAIATGLEDPFYVLDARRLPDGLYEFRVVAADDGSQPPGHAMRVAREAPPLLVDNTPPSVLDAEVRRVRETVEVHVRIREEGSPLTEVRYAVDGGDWIPALPVDGVADGPLEDFVVQPGPLSGGAHSLAVLARDASGNTTVRRIEIPAR